MSRTGTIRTYAKPPASIPSLMGAIWDNVGSPSPGHAASLVTYLCTMVTCRLLLRPARLRTENVHQIRLVANFWSDYVALSCIHP
jgi:hypothetical protein